MQFPNTVLPFLKELRENNNKEWFHAHKKQYQAVKKEFEGYLEALIPELRHMDESIGEQEVKKTTFRINRDIRFSKDKSPYKANMGSNIAKGGKKSGFGGYYLHVQPGGSFLVAGIYGPEKEALAKIRQEIDYNLDEFRALVEAPAFRKAFGDLHGNPLKTAPKGYDKSQEGIEYLRLRNFYGYAALSDQALEAATISELVETFSVGKPFLAFLNRAIAEA